MITCPQHIFAAHYIFAIERRDRSHVCASPITVYPKKYAHSFVVLCFVVVMQSFIMNSHEVFIHIHQGCFAGTGAIVRLPQCQWSKPDGYRKISPCITTTKHSKAKTVCIFLGIYCTSLNTKHLRRWAYTSPHKYRRGQYLAIYIGTIHVGLNDKDVILFL